MGFSSKGRIVPWTSRKYLYHVYGATRPWNDSERTTLEKKTEMRDGYNLHDVRDSINILNSEIYKEVYTLLVTYGPVDAATIKKTLGIGYDRIQHVVDELSKYFPIWEDSRILIPGGTKEVTVYGVLA